MKEVDDTPVTESKTEIERLDDELNALTALVMSLRALVMQQGNQIANLETQRTPADNNMDDPEWY